MQITFLNKVTMHSVLYASCSLKSEKKIVSETTKQLDGEPKDLV